MAVGVGNLILAVIAIVWGLAAIDSKRMWLPIVLIAVGAGWLVDAVVRLS